MADWTDQDTNSLLPGEPWTGAKAIASFENPVAIAEGAPGAPVLSTTWHAHDADANDESSGLIWSHAVSGNTATIETPVFVAGYDYRLALVDLGGGDVQINLRRSGAETYLTAQTLFTGTAVLRASGYVVIQFPSVSRRTFAVSGGEDVLQFNSAADSTIDRARLTTTTGSFVRGRAYLFRRRIEGF